MVRANRIPIKAVNKVQYQWGKYCMINVCSMDVPWMSLPFFLSFNPLAPNYCFPYNFYDSEMFFRLVVSMGPRRHCFLTRTQDFSFCHGHARDKTQKSSIITMILFYSTFIISVWRIWYWMN